MLTNSRIVSEYRTRTPESGHLASQASTCFPSGITHDARYLKPYGIYTDHAQGARKWDVDGNEYVDYFGGHGALLLGHNHPDVISATQKALMQGTHFGTSHQAEITWAGLVREMVPCAELVRFTSSGTEATHMALRLARAYTGKRKLLRVKTHFHGWHDHMTSGYSSHFDGSATSGVLPEVAASVVLVAPEDKEELRAAIADNDDIAAAIIEPTGSSFGKVPASEEYLQLLRELTAAAGIVLVFDEVVTGFRVSPGGAQAYYGITPDLTTLAKIIAGGLPGGAVAGRTDILQRIDFQASADNGFEKIQHPGTYNANPVSAAAGITALQIIKDGDACTRANDYAAALRDGMNEILLELDIPWAVYGTFSGFQIFTNPNNRAVRADDFDPFSIPYEELKTCRAELSHKLQLAMLSNGVHINGWPGGLVSATHSNAEHEQTLHAFRQSLLALKAESEIQAA